VVNRKRVASPLARNVLFSKPAAVHLIQEHLERSPQSLIERRVRHVGKRRGKLLVVEITNKRNFLLANSDLELLRKAQPHYVRCIKPNTKKLPVQFEPHLVLEQLRYSGVFEAVHGSAPDIAGQGIANPLGLIKSSVLLLEHVGELSSAERLDAAIRTALKSGDARTADLGGNATTDDVANAIIKAL